MYHDVVVFNLPPNKHEDFLTQIAGSQQNRFQIAPKTHILPWLFQKGSNSFTTPKKCPQSY